MEEQLVSATWGLVIATFLLVMATTIPFVGDLLRRRDQRGVVASRTVPDLNIVRSRLEDAVERLDRPEGLEKMAVTRRRHSCDGELSMLAPIIDVRDASLVFTNELFILRHLLTFCSQNLSAAEDMFDVPGPETVRLRDEKLRSVRRSYQAALLTLDAAEATLPKRHTTIDGERFWDRFARVSDERENEAAKQLLERERVHRTAGRSS